MSTNPVGTEPLSLPHFDEEATLLSARPVVPLHEVIAETRSKRRLIFASVIVAAVLLGALGASLYLTSGEQKTKGVAAAEQGHSGNADSNSKQNDPNSPSDTAATSPVDSGEPPVLAEQTDQADEPSTIERTSRRSPITRTPASPISTSSGRTQTRRSQRSETQNEEEYAYEDERRLRREERREGRRLRRERRNRSERSSDDLMRIREIFEGARRP